MKRMISVVLIVSLIALTNVCLAEVVFEDDFSGTEIDTIKWSIHETPACSQTATVTQNEELIIELPPNHNNCGSWGVVAKNQFSQFTNNVSYEVDYRTTTLHNWQDIPMNFNTPIGNIHFRNYLTRWMVMWNNESGGEERLVVITESMTEAVYHLKIEIDNGILKFWRAVGTGDYVLLHSVNEGEFSLDTFGSVGLYSSDRGHSIYDNIKITNGEPIPVALDLTDEPIYVIQAFSFIPIIETAYITEFGGEHSSNDVDLGSIRLNETIVPTGFNFTDDDKVEIEFLLRDLIIQMLPLFDTSMQQVVVSGMFLDGTVFSGKDSIIVIGRNSSTLEGKYLKPEGFDEISSVSEPLPTTFTLNQNYPNPFNPTTEISFNLPNAANIKLEIFNIMGQRITTLVDKNHEAGNYSVQWDASCVASGVYFYRLQAEDLIATKKMVLLK